VTLTKYNEMKDISSHLTKAMADLKLKCTQHLFSSNLYVNMAVVFIVSKEHASLDRICGVFATKLK